MRIIETLRGISFDAFRTYSERVTTESRWGETRIAVPCIVVSVSRSRIGDVLELLPVLTTGRAS